MFQDRKFRNFIIDQSVTSRTLIRHRDGSLVAKQRLETGVFSNWTRTRLIQNLKRDKQEQQKPEFEIHSIELTRDELSELNRLQIHSFGLLFCHEKLETWWLAAYVPNPNGQPCNNFHNAPGKTGV